MINSLIKDAEMIAKEFGKAYICEDEDGDLVVSRTPVNRIIEIVNKVEDDGMANCIINDHGVAVWAEGAPGSMKRTQCAFPRLIGILTEKQERLRLTAHGKAFGGMLTLDKINDVIQRESYTLDLSDIKNIMQMFGVIK